MRSVHFYNQSMQSEEAAKHPSRKGDWCLWSLQRMVRGKQITLQGQKMGSAQLADAVRESCRDGGWRPAGLPFHLLKNLIKCFGFVKQMAKLRSTFLIYLWIHLECVYQLSETNLLCSVSFVRPERMQWQWAWEVPAKLDVVMLVTRLKSEWGDLTALFL